MGEENISNAFEYFNPSPSGAKVGDCVIRALCKALNKSWEDVYVHLCVQGFIMHDLPNSDPIWGAYGRSFENNGGRSNDGMSYDRMSYDSNRNRDSMGRYSRDAFMDKLMEMRMSAPNDKAKRAVDKMIDELEN